MTGHVASADVRRLDLNGGDWIEVKRELSVGDSRRVMQAIPHGEDAVAVARILAWVTDWSMRDAKGKDLKFSEAGINALNMRVWREINDALDKYIPKADEDQEKNESSDPKTSTPTS